MIEHVEDDDLGYGTSEPRKKSRLLSTDITKERITMITKAFFRRELIMKTNKFGK